MMCYYTHIQLFWALKVHTAHICQNHRNCEDKISIPVLSSSVSHKILVAYKMTSSMYADTKCQSGDVVGFLFVK